MRCLVLLAHLMARHHTSTTNHIRIEERSTGVFDVTCSASSAHTPTNSRLLCKVQMCALSLRDCVYGGRRVVHKCMQTPAVAAAAARECSSRQITQHIIYIIYIKCKRVFFTFISPCGTWRASRVAYTLIRPLPPLPL